MGYIENLWSQLPGHQDYEEILKVSSDLLFLLLHDLLVIKVS